MFESSLLIDLLKGGGIGALVVGTIFLLFQKPVGRLVLPNIPSNQVATLLIAVLFCLWSMGMVAISLSYISSLHYKPLIACKSPFPPPTMKQVETDWQRVDHHGTWFWSESSKSFNAGWGHVSAIVSIANASNGVYQLNRVDQGAGHGFSAVYVGYVLPYVQDDGLCRIEGIVTWAPSQPTESQGQWFGTWQ